MRFAIAGDESFGSSACTTERRQCKRKENELKTSGSKIIHWITGYCCEKNDVVN